MTGLFQREQNVLMVNVSTRDEANEAGAHDSQLYSQVLFALTPSGEDLNLRLVQPPPLTLNANTFTRYHPAGPATRLRLLAF
jgi:hypothetical protein